MERKYLTRRVAAAMAAIAAAAGAGAGEPAEEVVDRLRKKVAAANLRESVDRLAAFGTRHTLSETDADERGIGAARRWVKRRFEEVTAEADRDRPEGAKVRVWFDSHVVGPGRRLPREVEVVNVACEIPGLMAGARDRRYYVLAHLDSRNSDGMDAQGDAPGANDDASGVAALIELARMLSAERLDATVVLLATSGEEQGLYGATKHAEMARENGWNIPAVLNNDTIGDPGGVPTASGEPRTARDRIRVFSEGVPQEMDAQDVRRMWLLGSEHDSPGRQIARFMEEVAQRHALPVRPMLVFRPDRFLRGGDHTPFNRLGFPAVRLTEVYEDYDRQHQDVREENGRQFGDLPEHVDEGYLADVTLLNAATLVHLANAPSTPGDARVIAADLTNDTTVRWSASGEPDVAGYEVVWRETTSPVWQYAIDVGDANEATVDLSKDNWLFGVRAYDTDGYRSPVAPCGSARD